MGEYYAGDLELEFPETIKLDGGLFCPISEPLLAYLFGPDLDDEELADIWLMQEFGTADRDLLAEFHANEITAMDAFIEELCGLASSVSEGAEELDVSGLTVHIWGEHNYGCAFFYSNTGVQDFGQQFGVAYTMYDDGKYELPGEHIEWRPGWTGEKHRGHHSGDIVMDRPDMRALWKQAAANRSVFTDLIFDYFEELP